MCVEYTTAQLESKLTIYATPSRRSICFRFRPDIHKEIATLQQNPPYLFRFEIEGHY